MESPPTKFTFIHEDAPGVSLSDRARASVEESGHSNYYSYRQTVWASGQPALQALVVRRRRYLAHLSPLCAAFQVGFGTSGQHTGHFGALGSPAWEFGQIRLCYGMCALETWARGWSSSVHGSDANK